MDSGVLFRRFRETAEPGWGSSPRRIDERRAGRLGRLEGMCDEESVVGENPPSRLRSGPIGLRIRRELLGWMLWN